MFTKTSTEPDPEVQSVHTLVPLYPHIYTKIYQAVPSWMIFQLPDLSKEFWNIYCSK
jgi:hypothetical protein